MVMIYDNGRDEAVRDEIKKALSDLNYGLVCYDYYSSHPGDSYMHVVCGKNRNRQSYATWIYNSSLRSLNHGHYDLPAEAWEADYNDRFSLNKQLHPDFVINRQEPVRSFESGRWRIALIYQDEFYGLTGRLINDYGEPLVEFYDREYYTGVDKYDHPGGKFMRRYSLSTLCRSTNYSTSLDDMITAGEGLVLDQNFETGFISAEELKPIAVKLNSIYEKQRDREHKEQQSNFTRNVKKHRKQIR